MSGPRSPAPMAPCPVPISSHFERVWPQAAYGADIAELRNELWAPIHETFGIWEVWVGWKEDSTLLALFYEPILSSMPKGSIYFGGTVPGRFVVTTANALQKLPHAFCITQNALADNTYASHLRAIYGDEIWIPDETDSTRAFQRYAEEVRSGKRGDSKQIKMENGRVQVTGVEAVMELNGILCEMIFEHNKDEHAFFVEESYMIPWMYPYLEPHGLIMKLNREPVDQLSPETVARDRAFWKEYEELLQSQSGFADNEQARIAFSKLRSAIGGIFAYRKLYDDAEAAFRQAIRFYPDSMEAHVRLAELYEEQERLSEAIRTMADYLQGAPPYFKERAEEYMKQFETRRHNNGSEPIR